MTSAIIILFAFFVGWEEPHDTLRRWLIMAGFSLYAALNWGSSLDPLAIGPLALPFLPLTFVSILAQVALPFLLAIQMRRSAATRAAPIQP